MKTIRNYGWIGYIGLAVLASCLGAGLANAQEVKGRFTLPFDAYWGQITLPAGVYSFTLDKAQSGGGLKLVRGTEAVGIIHAQAYNPKTADHSFLTVTRERGVNSVRELTLSEPGLVLYYGPHRPRPGSAAEEKEMSRMIPLAVPKR